MVLSILFFILKLSPIFGDYAIVDPYFLAFQNQNSSFYPDLETALEFLSKIKNSKKLINEKREDREFKKKNTNNSFNNSQFYFLKKKPNINLNIFR
jgi:hypothetical protein